MCVRGYRYRLWDGAEGSGRQQGVTIALIGYARTSTMGQSLESQLHALRQAGVEKIFEDEGVSGKHARRPALDACLAYMREGDTLVVYSLSRLGRSTRNLLELIDELRERGINFRSLTEAIDTNSGPTGRLMLTLLSSLAELERDVLIERTRAGLESARAQGRHGGRRTVMTPERMDAMRRLHEQGISPTAIARSLGVGRSTVYRALERAEDCHLPG